MANKTYITVSFNTEGDRDILRWLGQQENRSAAVRDVIREHLAQGGVTIGHVYRAIQELERKLQAGLVVRPDDGGDGLDRDVPADVAAALDALGKV